MFYSLSICQIKLLQLFILRSSERGSFTWPDASFMVAICLVQNRLVCFVRGLGALFRKDILKLKSSQFLLLKLIFFEEFDVTKYSGKIGSYSGSLLPLYEC